MRDRQHATPNRRDLAEMSASAPGTTMGRSPRAYLLLMTILSQVIFVLVFRYPISPTVAKGPVVIAPLILELQAKVCIHGQNKGVEPAVAISVSIRSDPSGN